MATSKNESTLLFDADAVAAIPGFLGSSQVDANRKDR
jgi:hypothetical protein